MQNKKTIYFVNVEVENKGNMDGEEVVQLYASYLDARHTVPLKQLKGFKKVFVPKGETIKVNFTIKKDDISFWSADTKKWQIEKGKILINIGSSSKDIRFKSVIEL